MGTTRAVAGLASHTGFAPGRMVGIGSRVKALVHVGDVAVDAHEVCGLLYAGPVQRVTGHKLLAGIKVKPVLTARRHRPRVPGDAESLQAPARQLHQVLLQRLDAQRELDLEVAGFAVRPRGVNQVTPVAAQERRLNSVLAERRVLEIAPHSGLARML